MKAPNELTFTLNMSVDKRTAETCLHLVQLYINSHSGTFVSERRNENGEAEYFIEEWTKP